MIALDIEEQKQQKLGASLKVIGVGGAGGNAVNSMINSSSLDNVDFIVANTDAQALSSSFAEKKIQLGSKITKGLGAGSKPEVGQRAAEEDLDAVVESISETDILFLTAGLGGGTGSGALPVISKSAKDMGVLTVAVVATPFSFEGRRRLKQAQSAIERLKDVVDTLIIVPNEKLLSQADPKITMLDAFSMSDDVLLQAVKGISDIITRAGHINVDFADVKEIMQNMGMALMGTGRAEGENRALEAAKKAVNSPLLEDMTIQGAKGVLINITGNTDLGLQEINEAASFVHDMVCQDAEIILGSVIDPNMGNEIMVTVIATGFEKEKKEELKAENKDSLSVKKAENVQKVPEIREKEVLDHNNKISDTLLINSFKDNTRIIPSNVSDKMFDAQDLDTPAFLRKRAEEKAFTRETEVINKSDKDENINRTI